MKSAQWRRRRRGLRRQFGLTPTVAGRAQHSWPAGESPPDRVPSRNAHVVAAGWIVAAIALVVFLKWAEALLIPLFLGIILAYTLAPFVDVLDGMRLPRVVSTTIVMAIVLAGSGWIAVSLRHEVNTIVNQLPEKASRLRAKIRTFNAGSGNVLQKVRDAASELDRAANEAAIARGGVPKAAVVATSATPVSSTLKGWFDSNLGVVGNGVLQAVIVVLLAYSVLSAGPLFRQKLLAIVGPALSARKEAIRTLDQIQRQMQLYLLSLTVANVFIGLAIWGAFAVIGVQNAGVWGVAAALLHFVPYAGPLLMATLGALAIFLQNGSYAESFAVAVVVMAINGAIGLGVVTWMQARVYRVSATALFLSLLFFGWLWGTWGIVLAAPLLGVIKVTVDHVPSLQPASAMLSP